jgi:hypothetical protein
MNRSLRAFLLAPNTALPAGFGRKTELAFTGPTGMLHWRCVNIEGVGSLGRCGKLIR